MTETKTKTERVIYANVWRATMPHDPSPLFILGMFDTREEADRTPIHPPGDSMVGRAGCNRIVLRAEVDD